MKIFKVFAVGLMIAACGLPAAYGATQAAADMPDGVIAFAEKYENGAPGGDQCSIAAITGYYNMNYHGCKNDQMTYFRLDNVPSATTFKLESEKCSGGSHRWYFLVKSYIHPTTTAWVSIMDLASKSVGDIVTKGMILVDKYDDGGVPHKGKLSCLNIVRSQLP